MAVETTKAQPWLRVAIDVDGVLGDQVPHVLDRANREKSLSMKKSDIVRWDTMVGDETFPDLIDRYFHTVAGFALSMPTVEGAVESVVRLSASVKLVVVTGRPDCVYEDTRAWVRNRFPVKLQVVRDRTPGKTEIAADVLVDDFPGHFAYKGGTRRLGILFDQPWNRDERISRVDPDSQVVFVAKSWLDVESIVARIAVEKAGKPPMGDREP